MCGCVVFELAFNVHCTLTSSHVYRINPSETRAHSQISILIDAPPLPQNVEFLNNPARFTDPYRFRVTFECLSPLPDGTLLVKSLHTSHSLYSHRPRVETNLCLLPRKCRSRPRTRFLSRRPSSPRNKLFRIPFPVSGS